MQDNLYFRKKMRIRNLQFYVVEYSTFENKMLMNRIRVKRLNKN